MDSNHTVISHFSSITEPRKNINIKHKLIDIIVITLCAVISGCDEWIDISHYANSKLDWFKKFLELPNGIPSSDRFRVVFSMIDPIEFEKCFKNWVSDVIKKIDKEVIAVDGKTIRRSKDKKNGKDAIHMVSAWARENNLVLGQIATATKSNEITAIPQLLDLIEISGCIVTIDAMGCQQKIAKKITLKKADYIFGLKENQPTIYKQTEEYFSNIDLEKDCSVYIEEEKSGHGRVEKREYYLTQAPGCMNASHTWDNFKSIGMVKSERLIDGKLSTEIRYYISSLENNAKIFGNGVRSHWSIENSLHWQLDISFREDECRKRVKHSAQNFSLIRKIALNLLKNEGTKKGGIKARRKLCGWDNDYLLKVLQS